MTNSADTTVKLVLNNQEIAGWTQVRITRGIERLPMDPFMFPVEPIKVNYGFVEEHATI